MIRLLPATQTLALLAIDGSAAATFNTIVEANPSNYEGPAGNAITLALANTGTWVPNIGTLTFAGNAVAAETVTIDATVYTWRASPSAAFEVLVGGSAAASVINLAAAINLNGTAGTTYGAATTIHPTVRAYDGPGDTVVVHTKSNLTLTAVGTLIATTETMTQGSWAATTLADGTDGTNITFVEVGTAITCGFAANYSTAADFEAALLADAGASALIRTKTACTTPLYVLLSGAGADVFSATNLAGGGSTSSAAPTATDSAAGVALPYLCDQALILLRSTNGSGVMTADIRLRGWSAKAGRWYTIGSLNNGTAVPELSADLIDYTELVVGLRAFSRVHAQIITLGGTATEVELNLGCVAAAFLTN